MGSFKIQGPLRIKGRIILPGDKSISHRFAILSCLSRNSTVINNFSFNDDCLATLRAFKSLGARIVSYPRKNLVKIRGNGLRGFKKPSQAIFVGESGTTLRLLSGILSGQNFRTRLICSRSLAQRPMLRLTAPLRKMGAKIIATVSPFTAGCSPLTENEEYPPLIIQGGELKAISYRMVVASAQVKSAILLAGLYAKGQTRVIEPIQSRDHTERLLKVFGAGIKIKGKQLFIRGGKELCSPGAVYVPGDISSAAFFIVLASITTGSRVLLKNVSLNPSRIGIIQVFQRMGADIRVTRSQSHCAKAHPGASNSAGCKVTKFEPMGDIEVKSSRLKGTTVKKSEIPSLIDELPVLMVAACFAQGKSRFEGAGELRVKETDRIKSMFENLRKMGADMQVTSDEDIVIFGGSGLRGAKVKSFNDHRTAMSMIVAGLAACGTTTIDDTSCISKSFPNFLKVLKSVVK